MSRCTEKSFPLNLEVAEVSFVRTATQHEVQANPITKAIDLWTVDLVIS